MSKRFMNPYYWTFSHTGEDEVDAIIESIAIAGKAFHNTSEWDEPIDDDKDLNYWNNIQDKADSAAQIIINLRTCLTDMTKERDWITEELKLKEQAVSILEGACEKNCILKEDIEATRQQLAQAVELLIFSGIKLVHGTTDLYCTHCGNIVISKYPQKSICNNTKCPLVLFLSDELEKLEGDKDAVYCKSCVDDLTFCHLDENEDCPCRKIQKPEFKVTGRGKPMTDKERQKVTDKSNAIKKQHEVDMSRQKPEEDEDA